MVKLDHQDHTSHSKTHDTIITIPIRISLSRNVFIASSAFLPYTPIRIASRPNLRLLPQSPAIINALRFISPIPATHPKTLYGIGEKAAMKIPSVPYLVVRASNFLMCFGLANLSSKSLPTLSSNQVTNMILQQKTMLPLRTTM